MEPSQRRRAGCTECKRKKAKCDEKRPSCSRCYKYPHLCSYELSVKSFKVAKRKPANNAQILTQPSSTDETADEQQVSLAPSSVATSNQLISYTDMSDTFERNFVSSSMIDDPSDWLFHFPAESPPRHSLSISFPSSPPLRSDPRRIYFQHFVAHTAIVYWPLQPDMALSLILPAADLSPCIMGAMIAASSSQLFRMVRNPESRSAAITATVECLGNLREAITTPRFGDVGVTILPTTLMLATTRVDELPKDNPKVQTTVDSIITSLQKIDKQSPVHAQLLWPLLAAGCDSTTHAERTIVVETMESMTARGLGSYENVLEFMRDYWKNGGDMRWDLFAKQTGKDLVLF
ncbi:hypothetical protein FOC4_g10003302 [Fusarium odoratissimum]|uniref:Zn(2)-C6 fungal-type domain-containing protein n=2 Tax=Fusarium oxysporum species complex TaxID=171631 RepID=N1RVX0_FUSC4|nr:hypothetical protein FOC4_g10003302 [Fusarium odoratissimum]TXB96454.1 hypothetical protein FocTR4_00011732 [Fusarium oxysporum f. sp. cubense]